MAGDRILLVYCYLLAKPDSCNCRGLKTLRLRNSPLGNSVPEGFIRLDHTTRAAAHDFLSDALNGIFESRLELLIIGPLAVTHYWHWKHDGFPSGHPSRRFLAWERPMLSSVEKHRTRSGRLIYIPVQEEFRTVHDLKRDFHVKVLESLSL